MKNLSICNRSRFLIYPAIVGLLMLSCVANDTETKSKPSSVKGSVESIYSIHATTITGQSFSFDMLKGKKILIVNTASKCSNAPQYEDLQKLSVKYGDKIVILGFPCNDFGGQEYSATDEISAFCKKNYGVTFQMFEKVLIKGSSKHPLYEWLTNPALNGWNDQEPTWNFCKYLIDENGELVKYYGPGVIPTSKEILGIEE